MSFLLSVYLPHIDILRRLESRDEGNSIRRGEVQMKNSTIRELSYKEIQQVSGGLVPLIGLGLSVASHFMARSVAGSLISRAGYALGVYGAAAYFDDK